MADFTCPNCRRVYMDEDAEVVLGNLIYCEECMESVLDDEVILGPGVPPRCPECGEPVVPRPSTFQGEWQIVCSDRCGYKVGHRETVELAWGKHWSNCHGVDDVQDDRAEGVDNSFLLEGNDGDDEDA